MADYPEHEKMKAVTTRSQAIGEFIEWLGEEGMAILKWQEAVYHCRTCGEIPKREARAQSWLDSDSDALYFHKNNERCDDDVDLTPAGHYPHRMTIEKLLAKHFDIDLDKIEAEKRAMLDEMRSAAG